MTSSAAAEVAVFRCPRCGEGAELVVYARGRGGKLRCTECEHEVPLVPHVARRLRRQEQSELDRRERVAQRVAQRYDVQQDLAS